MTGISADEDAVDEFWEDYCDATGADEDSLESVEHFGDSPEMADRLLDLVLNGPKRATAGLASDYTDADEPLPEPGGHWIVVDGTGTPRCILRTTEIRVGTLKSVDDAFAWDEGEGDRSRDDWLASHRAFFQRQGKESGVPFDEGNDLIVFERFDLVWPQ